MTTRRVSTPDGVMWSVRRLWLPHREGKGVVQRFRKHSKPNAADFPDLPLGIGDGAAGLVIALMIGIALILLFVFGWPVILLGIDLAWLLLVGVLGVIGRIVLRRPWRVEAVSKAERRSWFVKGYHAAGRERDEIAGASSTNRTQPVSRRHRCHTDPMAATTDFVIRAAQRPDADGITDVQVASWRAGYAHVFPDSVLYADDFESSRRTFWNNWRFGPGHRVVVVTEENDDGGERVIGFCSYGPERERARGFTGRGEVWAFYLHPDRWGCGAAADLMEHVEQRLKAEGFATVVLWVLDDNPRARRFYERQGWAATGIAANFDDYCEVSVPEVEYRKEL